jgi:hypothetical protein
VEAIALEPAAHPAGWGISLWLCPEPISGVALVFQVGELSIVQRGADLWVELDGEQPEARPLGLLLGPDLWTWLAVWTSGDRSHVQVNGGGRLTLGRAARPGPRLVVGPGPSGESFSGRIAALQWWPTPIPELHLIYTRHILAQEARPLLPVAPSWADRAGLPFRAAGMSPVRALALNPGAAMRIDGFRLPAELNALSVEAWIHPGWEQIAGPGTTWMGPIAGQHGPGSGFELRFFPTRAGFMVTLSGRHIEVLVDTAPCRWAWMHVAGVWNGRSLRIFVNGVPGPEVDAVGALSAADFPLHVGRNPLFGAGAVLPGRDRRAANLEEGPQPRRDRRRNVPAAGCAGRGP